MTAIRTINHYSFALAEFVRHQMLVKHRIRLIRGSIVFLCFALAIILPKFLLSQGMMAMMVPMAPVGLGVALVCLYRIEWGLVLLYLTTLILRFSFSTGTESPLLVSLLFTLLLTGIWLARMLVFEKRIRIVAPSTAVPLALFILVVLISLAWSWVFVDPMVADLFAAWLPKARLGSGMTIILSCIAFYLMANNLHDELWMRRIVNVFLFFGAIGAVLRIASVPFSMLNTHGLYSTWAAAIAMSQLLFNKSLGKWQKVFMLYMVGAWFYVSFIQGISWMSGWVPMIAVLGLLAMLRSRWLAVALVILILVFIVANSSYFLGILSTENDESGHTRIDAWAQNINVIVLNHLLFGVGPAGYGAYYMTYIPNDAMATHNNYLDIASQFGITGIVTYLWFWIAATWTGIQAIRRTPSGTYIHALSIGLTAGIAGAFIAMGLGDWLLPYAHTQGIAGYDYTVWSWLFAGMLVAIAVMYKDRPPAQPATKEHAA